jgi:hypothetical protein
MQRKFCVGKKSNQSPFLALLRLREFSEEEVGWRRLDLVKHF